MKRCQGIQWSAASVGLVLCVFSTSANAGPTLRQVRSIPLENVEGRMDHLALDASGQILFLAALGNNTLEVVDLRAAKRVRQIKGLKEPQGVVLIPDSNTLVVASGEDGKCRFYDPTQNVVATIDGLEDADNVRFDAEQNRLYVGYGAGALAVIDVRTRKKITDIALEGHPESFQLESKGRRIFVNVPSARQVAVVDRDQQSVIDTWPMTEAEQNYPMALDESNHRLFIGCRKPAKLMVLDTATGKTVQSQPCCGDADDVFHDAEIKRIYLSGGEGCISVFEYSDSGAVTEIDRLPTAAGARTCLYAANQRSLFLAVPHRDPQQAEIRVFEKVGPSP